MSLAVACASELSNPLDPMTLRVGTIPVEGLREAALDTPGTQRDRERRLRELFGDAGCSGDQLDVVSVDSAHSNVVCTLPGTTQSTIVVAAHLDKPRLDRSEGAQMSGKTRPRLLQNWTGCVLLPVLYRALGVERRRHTFVFAAFSDLGDRRSGSRQFWDGLDPDARERIEAMVNLIALGIGSPAVGWRRARDRNLAIDLHSVSESLELSLRTGKLRSYFADALTFRRHGIPAITLHSIEHRDTAYRLVRPDRRQHTSLIDLDQYQSTARLLAIYLAYLDHTIPMRRDPVKEAS